MIANTPPIAGTVIRYNYLWKRQADEGQEEGEKDRPVALLLAKAPADGECIVVPITHSPPDDPVTVIEIPALERARLGLDGERSWIVLTEFNAFLWPGPDLRAVPGREPSTTVYGLLSKDLYTRVLTQVQTLIRARLVGPVSRT